MRPPPAPISLGTAEGLDRATKQRVCNIKPAYIVFQGPGDPFVRSCSRGFPRRATMAAPADSKQRSIPFSTHVSGRRPCRAPRPAAAAAAAC